jgi:hypothetical protein
MVKKSATKPSAPATKAKTKPAKPAEDSEDEDEFTKLAGSTKYKKAWKEARKVDAGESGPPALPDGQYTAQVTACVAGVTKARDGKGKELYFKLSTVITQGKHKGVRVPLFFSLEPERMEWAVKAVKRLGYEFEDDSASPADMKEIAEDLNEVKPLIQLAAKNVEVEVIDQTTKKKSKQSRCNWYVNRALAESEEVEEPEEDEEEVDEEGDESEEEVDEEGEGEEDESEEEVDEDDAEEEVEIEKGDVVLAKLAGDKKPVEYTVLQVDNNKGTATVKGIIRKNTVKGVSLDDLEPVFDEE